MTFRDVLRSRTSGMRAIRQPHRIIALPGALVSSKLQLVIHQGDRPRTSRRGVSLMELMITVVMIGILTSFAVPSFHRAVDQSRADIAGANLRAIWSAQRCYWLDNRTYCEDLSQLQSLGLIDPTVVAGSGFYSYAITAADATSFMATATRVSGTKWNGEFVIDQSGTVSGEVTAAGEQDLVPAFQ